MTAYHHVDMGAALSAAAYGFLATIIHNPTLTGACISVAVALVSGFAAKAGAWLFSKLVKEKP